MDPNLVKGMLGAAATVGAIALWLCLRQASQWRNPVALLLLIQGIVLLTPDVFGFVLDERVAYIDAHGQQQLVVTGLAALVARYGSYLEILAPVTCLLAGQWRARLNLPAALALGLAVVAALSTEYSGNRALTKPTIALLLTLAAVAVSPGGGRTVTVPAALAGYVAVLSGFAPILDYNQAVEDCTGLYKCGPLGFLLLGVIGNENALSLFLVGCLPFVWLAFNGVPRNALVIYIVAIILVSGSRTAALAAAATVLVCVVATLPARARYPRRAVAVPLGAVVLGFTASLLLPFVVNDNAQFTGRGLLWRIAKAGVAQRPLLGSGSATWGQLVDSRAIGQFGGYSAHNELLDLAWTAGAVGVVAFISLVVVLLRHNAVMGSMVLAPVAFAGLTERPWTLDRLDLFAYAYLAALATVSSGAATSNRVVALGRASGQSQDRGGFDVTGPRERTVQGLAGGARRDPDETAYAPGP